MSDTRPDLRQIAAGGGSRKYSQCKHCRARGFTLIELLVVLIIIGIVTSVALLSVGALGKDPPAQEAAERLAALIQYAADDAVMQSREIGLIVKPHSYRFVQYDGADWSAIEGDPVYRERDLGDDVQLALTLEGRKIRLGNDKQALRPDIVLLSSGELTPFELRVTGVASEEPYLITGSMDKGIRYVAPGTNP